MKTRVQTKPNQTKSSSQSQTTTPNPTPQPLKPSLDLVSYVLQTAIAAIHVQRAFVDEGWFSVMIASQHVLMWWGEGGTCSCGGAGAEWGGPGRGRARIARASRRPGPRLDLLCPRLGPPAPPPRRTKLQYFARVFNPTKTTFIDTIRLGEPAGWGLGGQPHPAPEGAASAGPSPALSGRGRGGWVWRGGGADLPTR
jgi:hypothetical protein